MSQTSLASENEQVEHRAVSAGLTYVNDPENGIKRRRCGRGYRYVTRNGKTLADGSIRRRIELLMIPPAWEEVIICTKSNGHIQAMGIDGAGRRQYIYHPRWTAVSTATKFDRMERFGELLPKIRRRVARDLNRKGLARLRVLAAVVRLLDRGHLRVGNRAYAESTGAHGATTLRVEHVEVERTRVCLDFPGKSGQRRHVELSDRKVAKVVQECAEIQGHFLFQYVHEDEQFRSIRSQDVNEYIRTVSGESITAKDFRTWWGSVTALAHLETIRCDETPTEIKQKISGAIKATADKLGNTKAVCRSSYIHPGLIAAAEAGEMAQLAAKLPNQSAHGLTREETRLQAILPSLKLP